MTDEKRKEVMQLRSTEAHIIQLLEKEEDEETRALLLSKFARTQARRISIEMVES